MSSYRARVEFCRTHTANYFTSPLRMREDYPRISCDTCSKKFLCYSSLERHSLMEHDVALRNVYYGYLEGKYKMLCGYCGETERDIVKHLLEVHEKEIMVSFKLIQCPCCRIQFEHPSHFERHLQLHFCKDPEYKEQNKKS